MVKELSTNLHAQSSVINDYKQVKDFVMKNEKEVEHLDKKLSFTALKTVPIVKRISAIPEKFNDHDYLSAASLAGLAVVNLPEDCREILGAGKQVWSKIDKDYTYDQIYNRKDYQHSFSFFRGTLLDKPLHAAVRKGNKFAIKLNNIDRKTIYNTKFGEYIRELFCIEYGDVQRVEQIVDASGSQARKYMFQAKRFGGVTTARAMKRIPLLSVMVLGIMELPKIFGSHKNGETLLNKAEEVSKQTVKSGINITATLAGVGYLGAIGARHCGAVGSLVGMGVGALLGTEASKRLQNLVA